MINFDAILDALSGLLSMAGEYALMGLAFVAMLLILLIYVLWLILPFYVIKIHKRLKEANQSLGLLNMRLAGTESALNAIAFGNSSKRLDYFRDDSDDAETVELWDDEELDDDVLDIDLDEETETLEIIEVEKDA